MQHREIEDFVSNIAPDVLLIDVEAHYYILAASRTNIPIVLPMLWFTIFKRPGLPPLNTKLQPSGRREDQFRMFMAWMRVHLGAFEERLAMHIGRRAIASGLEPVHYQTKNIRDLKALAKHKNISWNEFADTSQWLRPAVYPSLPVLSLNSFATEFPHKPPQNVTYVGPMIFSNNQDKSVDIHVSDQPTWQRFQHHRATGENAPRPLIYCTLGSFWTPDTDFLCNVIDVFRNKSAWDLVIGLGGNEFDTSSNPVPDNVFLFRWAPQRTLLRQVDCAICHGGVSTINECISNAVPMIVFSTGHVDQNGNAARVAYHGLGIDADRRKSKPSDIEAHINACLQHEEMKQNLQAMRTAQQQDATDNIAVRVLEEIARKPLKRDPD